MWDGSYSPHVPSSQLEPCTASTHPLLNEQRLIALSPSRRFATFRKLSLHLDYNVQLDMQGRPLAAKRASTTMATR